MTTFCELPKHCMSPTGCDLEVKVSSGPLLLDVITVQEMFRAHMLQL